MSRSVLKVGLLPTRQSTASSAADGTLPKLQSHLDRAILLLCSLTLPRQALPFAVYTSNKLSFYDVNPLFYHADCGAGFAVESC